MHLTVTASVTVTVTELTGRLSERAYTDVARTVHTAALAPCVAVAYERARRRARH